MCVNGVAIDVQTETSSWLLTSISLMTLLMALCVVIELERRTAQVLKKLCFHFD